MIYYFQGNLDVPGDFPKLEAFLQTWNMNQIAWGWRPVGRMPTGCITWRLRRSIMRWLSSALGAAGMASQSDAGGGS